MSPGATTGHGCEVSILIAEYNSVLEQDLLVLRCAECRSDKFIVPPGKCTASRRCKVGVYSSNLAAMYFTDSMSLYESGLISVPEACTCDALTEDSSGRIKFDEGGLPLYNTLCDECYHRKIMGDNGNWNEPIPGEGVQCVSCKPEKYLYPGSYCLHEEEAIVKAQQNGFVLYAMSKYGYEVETPFSCVDSKKSTTGRVCRCPREFRSKGGIDCTWSIGDQGLTVIDPTACGKKRYLNDDGTCTTACPAGKTNYGVRTRYRSCEEPLVCDVTSGLPAVRGKPCVCANSRISKCEWFADNEASRKKDRSLSQRVSKVIKCETGALLKRDVSAFGAETKACVLPRYCDPREVHDGPAPDGEC
jgi:hypothetical protein